MLATASMLATAACAPPRLHFDTSASPAPSAPNSDCAGSYDTSGNKAFYRDLEVISRKTQAKAGAPLLGAARAPPEGGAAVCRAAPAERLEAVLQGLSEEAKIALLGKARFQFRSGRGATAPAAA